MEPSGAPVKTADVAPSERANVKGGAKPPGNMHLWMSQVLRLLVN